MLNTIRVKIKKLSNTAITPSYGSNFSAGADLYSGEETTVILPHKTILFKTGVSFEIPEGLVGLVYARSGLATKSDLAPANKVGVIDSDYRGEVLVALHNHGDYPQTISKGDRIAQIVFTPYFKADFIENEDLAATARGENGFGSTGK